MQKNLIELVKSLPHVLHATKMVVVELVFFGWGMIELAKFAMTVMVGHHGEQ